ncbi:MAG: COX15/CtaA family protein [Spirochaetia bacterium]|nr:COX15/CtaA family protein [Spirochaetia bacterium]
MSFTTMVMGPLVRAEDAGLACPDWPLCFGKVIPPYEYRVYLEFMHRVVAGITSISFVIWLIALLRNTDLRSAYGRPAIAALIFLSMQILLGGATITQKLNAYVVKSHLLNALLFLSALVWIRFRAVDDMAGGTVRNTSGEAASRWLPWVFIVFVFAQFYLGGRVSANCAGLACPEFPACYSQNVETGGGVIQERVFFPSMLGQIEKQMTHRFMAYFLILSAVSLIVFGARAGFSADQRQRTLWILGALSFQVAVGISNVIFRLPVPVTVLHSAAGIGLYLLTLRFLYRSVYREPSGKAA